MNKLNPRQLQAVKSIAQPTLVLAGAGSGKTSVITQKIAYLIEQCGMPARNIAAVTFTNKAAREMKERIHKLLPKQQTRGLLVSTFHTLGLTIIRKELNLIGLREGFSIYDSEDCRNLLLELAQRDGNVDKDMVDFVQQTISSLKNDLLTPELALQQATSPQEQMIAGLYLHYQQALRAYNAVDFDDLISIPVLLLQQNPSVLQSWRSRIRYLLVDEYQDTNHSQYELVKLLVGDRNGLTVVGDDDQSIYAWRGAKPENLARLQVDFPNLQLIKLEQNYRSTSVILTAANHLIAHNPHVFEKQLWSDLAFGEDIRIIGVRDDKAEAERVVNDIILHRLKNNGQYSDYAILYRGNHQARVIEMALQNEGLPYKLSGGQSFFARSEIKDIMAYLRLLVNPDDDNAFLRIINVPRRKIGTTTLQNLAHFARQQQTSLLQSLANPQLANELSPAAFNALHQFHQWFSELQQRAEQENAINVVRDMIEQLAYDAWLHQNSSSSAVAEKRMRNVWFLIENLQSALERAQEEDDDANLKQAINRLILRDMLEQQSEDEEDNSIQLLTLHASKGLEYPHVYIIGMEEELLPHRSSIESENIEEERRLAYVGITRARKTLTMTYAKKRKQFGEVIDTSYSRFLDELPNNNIYWTGREGVEADQAQKQKTAEKALSNLKNLFSEY